MQNDVKFNFTALYSPKRSKYYNIIELSIMEILSDDPHEPLPVYLWDEIKLKDKFERTSMEIFHQNELKLVELQEELNSSKSYTRNK